MLQSNKLKLSILIPVYNCEKFIDRCVKSIVNQNSVFDLEVVIVNDGSIDNTADIINNLAAKYSYIKVYHQKNQGVYKARNFGLKKLRGDYLWMLDADDYIAKDAFINLSNAFEEVDVFHLGYRQENKDENFDYRLPPGKDLEIVDGIEFLDRNDGRLFLWNNIYSLKFLQENNFTFLAKSVSLEDSLFNLQVFSKASKVKFIKKCFYSYLHNENSISKTKSKEHLLKQGESSINVHLNTRKLRDNYPQNSREYKVIHERLSHSILGFFYSLYIEKYPLNYIKKIFILYKEEKLLPISKSNKTIKLVIFEQLINLKWPFLWLCKLK
ncbi:Glycosyltransferase involved in cell wall bisynthesis [Mesonia phycicola]|uniref:Glycosyltransferase involved in cell wall bisynthesis n=1 Tax=Mesonia phycicola TaxID=579105 RepID=A0A1M6H2K8_9FLAO|nr:glycosyltransferase [Mesonia phycicola]SHJ16405.1 Glycosyltransferase involved in cell wall bisynthesis [Mesonia phycicola]